MLRFVCYLFASESNSICVVIENRKIASLTPVFLQTMQVFSPLASSRSVIAVAPPNDGDAPAVDRIVAFLVDGRLPYAYH